MKHPRYYNSNNNFISCNVLMYFLCMSLLLKKNSSVNKVYVSVSIKYGLRTEYEIRTRYKASAGKYGLGIKRGLRTGYKIRN